MYNDKNPLYSSRLQRDLPPREITGRSRPTFAKFEAEEQNIPRLDERQGRRLCDGTLPRADLNNGMNGCGCENDVPDHGCGSHVGGWGLTSYPLAMVYSPLQDFRELYDLDKALERGTLFAELDLPFEGGKEGKGGCRLC